MGNGLGVPRQFYKTTKLLKTIIYPNFTGHLLAPPSARYKMHPQGWILGDALCLAVQQQTRPPTPAARVLSPEGEDQEAANLLPVGEVALRADGGLIFCLPISPRRRGPRTLHTEVRGPAETQRRQSKFTFVHFGAVRERADLVV